MHTRLGLVGPGQRIHGLVALTPRESRAFDAARKALADRERDDDLYWMFDANCRDLDAFLSSVSDALAKNEIAESDLVQVHMEADRRVINILTAMRTFLDHWETKLKRRFGNPSREATRFKASCSKEFDRHFAYRFLSKLRNYAQHCGLPVGAIELKSRSRVVLIARDGSPSRPLLDPTRPRDEAKLLFDRRRLLEDFDGWGKVQQDLERRRGRIDVIAELRSLRKSVQRIHVFVRTLSVPGAHGHAGFLRSLMERVRVEDTRRVPVVYDARHLGKRPKVTLSMQSFPLAQMRELLPDDEYVALLIADARQSEAFLNV